MPPVSDPYWAEQAARLMPFLANQPRNWSSLKAWAKRKKIKQELLRNIIAWSETQDLATSFVDETKRGQDKVHWRALDDWMQTLGEIQKSEAR